MQYSRCGQSGVLLPRVSLGFWHNFGETTPMERSRQIALAAFDKGVVHFDLANNYGPRPGEAERRLGQLLRGDLVCHRDELFISTKAAYDMWEGPYGTWASRKHLMASLDQSLKRMGLSYVDLFYVHRYDPHTPLQETLQTLVDIVRSGKALYVGISRWPLQPLRYALQYLSAHDVPVLIYQGRLNLLDRAPLDEGILQEIVTTEQPPIPTFSSIHEGSTNLTAGVIPTPGFISFSPLAQGLLTDRYQHGVPADSRMAEAHFLKAEVLTPALQHTLQRLHALAAQRGESLARMSLAWILQVKGVTSVLIGASSVAQLEENLQCLDAAPFTAEELQLIDEACLRGVASN